MRNLLDSWKVWLINIVIAGFCYYGIVLLDGVTHSIVSNYFFKLLVILLFMQLTGFINLNLKFAGKTFKFSLRNLLETYVLKIDSNMHIFEELEKTVDKHTNHIKLYYIFIYISCIIMIAYFSVLLVLVLYPTVTYAVLAKTLLVYVVIATIIQLLATLLELIENLISGKNL